VVTIPYDTAEVNTGPLVKLSPSGIMTQKCNLWLSPLHHWQLQAKKWYNYWGQVTFCIQADVDSPNPTLVLSCEANIAVAPVFVAAPGGGSCGRNEVADKRDS